MMIGTRFARADTSPILNAAAKLPVNFTAAYYNKSRRFHRIAYIKENRGGTAAVFF